MRFRFNPLIIKQDRVRESPSTPVCPQNRAYGFVHGSSCDFYPLIKIKPMLDPVVRSYFLAQSIDEPRDWVCLGYGERCGQLPSTFI